MPGMNRRLRQLASLLRRPTVSEEVDAEFAFHVEMTTALLMEKGMHRDDARREAIKRFGDLRNVTAQCEQFGRQRDRRRTRAEYFGELRQDVLFGARQLARARSFAIVAVCTLALGIGATAAVFSALYAVVLHPLPFADASRVVKIQPIRRGEIAHIASGAEYAAIRAQHEAFASVAAIVAGGGATLTGYDTPEVIDGAAVTASYFRALGITPALGRGFLDSDDVPGAPHVAILSHRFWAQRFASDTTLIGRTLQLSGEPTTVIGVLPADFDAADEEDKIWQPLRVTTEQLTGSGGYWLQLIGRLAPGVTLEHTSAAAQTAVQVLAKRNPQRSQNVGAVVRRYLDVEVGDLRARLLVLLGAVGLVLLIACVNVANLLLARATGRARELAIRAALGAGRGRLIRQLLAESVLLATSGAVVGVGLAWVLVKAVIAVAPAGLPRLDQARINPIVLAFTLVIVVVTSLLIGLVPSLRMARADLQSALREGARGAGGTVHRERLRASLVAAEVALAMTLLTGSGLLIRTAWQLQHVDPGFKPSHVLAARVLLPPTGYADSAHIAQTYENIREAVARIPGVQRASLTSVVPLSGSMMTTSVAPEGRELTADERIDIDVRVSSPDYFASMGMNLLDGRDLQRTDGADAMQVAVISASLARKLWPGERAVGKRIDVLGRVHGEPNWVTVVGVVSDVHDLALNAPARPTVYVPFTQMQTGFWENALRRSLVLVVQTRPEPETLLRAVRQAVMSVDPSLPLADDHTMTGLLADSVAKARFNTLLLAALGAIALMLASVGVYGVVSYFVSQRTREIGVRIALGAKAANIWRLVFGRSLTPIGWGVALGVTLSLGATRLLRDQLYGVSSDDPVTLLAVSGTLLGVALVATLLPARRAMRVPPVVALTSE